MINTDTVKALCEAIIEAEALFYDNPNGAYEYRCPFCYSLKEVGGSKSVTMKDIDHIAGCAYRLAVETLSDIKETEPTTSDKIIVDSQLL